MRSIAILIAGLAACGSSSAAGPHPSAAPTPAAPTPAVAGTTGFEGVSFGDAVETLRAQYPALGDGSTLHQAVEGQPATVSFNLDGSAVHGVHVAFDRAYPTMGVCLGAWTSLRAKLDARLGASQSENGAAYWTTATAAVTAACNPDEGGAAALSIDFAPPATE
jgi:hypothetical protein